MRIDILTLFPEMVDNALNESIIGRGREAGLIDIRCHHIRDYSPDKRSRTDDYPYGGGQGMVMQCEPLARCLEDVQEGKKVHTNLMSPAGARFDQEKARELLAREHIILVCGHYEGVDRRFVDSCIDEELSIGDFVLTGGEHILVEYTSPRSSKPWCKSCQTDFEYAARRSLSFFHLPSRRLGCGVVISSLSP